VGTLAIGGSSQTYQNYQTYQTLVYLIRLDVSRELFVLLPSTFQISTWMPIASITSRHISDQRQSNPGVS
jgi:hypothetical protein